ncbi:MAG: Fur family transcriptional regulator [Anaerovoracaceae bacterium]|jgi:Fur family peroxide stress response transcriptional regulator
MVVHRNTKQKALINEALKELSHPTAEDIYRYVHSRYPSIGKATLYRNLKIMSEDGVINKISLSKGGAGRFDGCTHPHFHGECRVCGVVWDIEMDPVHADELRTNVIESGGFLIEDQEVVFKGLCPTCKKMEEKNERP